MHRFPDRLDRPDLVIDMHDTDEDGIIRERSGDFPGINPSVLINAHIGDAEPERFKVFYSLFHGGMFDAGGDDASPVLVLHGRPLDGQIIRLGPSRCEEDF